MFGYHLCIFQQAIASIYNSIEKGKQAMRRDSFHQSTATLKPIAHTGISKIQADLVILKYVAQQLYMTLQQPDSLATTIEPLRYALEDCQQRKQRIVLYKSQELQRSHRLSFVGFVSGTQCALNPGLVDEVLRIDELMVAELVNVAGIFSYSSLEIRPGRWYNLVVFQSGETKAHVKSCHTHAYAVYQLAPQYYEWIRLHNGIMPGGLAQQELVLQSTKYYTFQQGQRHPDMYEITYGH